VIERAVMDDASLRASDADRERALAELREHMVAGRLTLEEFCARADSALRAGVAGELAQLQDDQRRCRRAHRFRSPPRLGARRRAAAGAQHSCRVIGFAGTIDVWRVPRDLRGSSYREILRTLHDRRRQLR